ncbi:MAG: phage baseplate assembly protein V [Bacteroidia bacterium]|nr:phage baseplate assembly protein V [Bacteroidia bacterium]
MGLISKVKVEIDGEEIKNFVELRIRQNIYSHHEFEIKYRKENFEEMDSFPMENSKKFIGAAIKIEMEAFTDQFKKAKPALFFKGIITDIRASKSGMAQNDFIFLTGFSPDILLQDNPGCNSFKDVTLKQIVDKVIAPYPKDMLRYQVKPNNGDKHPYTVQYNESRYDFLRRLAVRFGEWFYYDGSELIYGTPTGKTNDLCLGEDLNDFAFSIRLNPLNMKYVTYNPSSAKPVESSTKDSTGGNQLNEYGNFAHQKSMKLYNQNSVRLYNHLATEESSYGTESGNVTELKGGGIALGMSAATGKSHNPELMLGGKAIVKAVREKEKGKVDYGEYIVTSITHFCDNLRNYSNEFACIPAKAKLPDYTDPLAFPHCDSQYAVVTDNNDPDKLGRVKVRFFWQATGAESPWIRIANAHAGSDSGFFFIPEVEEEVMVGFESGDAEKPYILGSLFNGKRKPAGSWGSSGNDVKAIRTRSGNTIELIDKKGNEEIIIYQENDKSAALHISMASGSDPKLNIFSKGKLIIEASSIEIKTSSGSIEINSKGKVLLKGATDVKVEAMNVNVKADMDLALKGLNVKAEADINLENKAGVVAKIDGGGMTVIKGGVVMIN